MEIIIECEVDSVTVNMVKSILNGFQRTIDEWISECREQGHSDCLIPRFSFDGNTAEYITCSGKGHYIIRLSDDKITIKFRGYRRSFLDGNLLLLFKEVPRFPENESSLTVIFCGEQPDGMPLELHLTGEVKEYKTSMPDKPLI